MDLLVTRPLIVWTKASLIAGAGVTDRRVRKAVERLRRSGIPIISGSGDIGYWFTEDPAELRSFIYREIGGRLASLSEQDAALKQTANRLASLVERQGVLLA